MVIFHRHHLLGEIGQKERRSVSGRLDNEEERGKRGNFKTLQSRENNNSDSKSENTQPVISHDTKNSVIH